MSLNAHYSLSSILNFLKFFSCNPHSDTKLSIKNGAEIKGETVVKTNVKQLKQLGKNQSSKNNQDSTKGVQRKYMIKNGFQMFCFMFNAISTVESICTHPKFCKQIIIQFPKLIQKKLRFGNQNCLDLNCFSHKMIIII